MESGFGKLVSIKNDYILATMQPLSTLNATFLSMHIKGFDGYKPIFCSANISIIVSGNPLWANSSFKEQSIVLENSGTL